MIELDLLPEEYKKKKKKKIDLPDIPIFPVVGLIVGALIVIQLVFYGMTYICSNQLESLEEKWAGLEPQKNELDSIKIEIRKTSKKIKAIDNLIEKRLSWAMLLNEISNSLTENIWLRNLSYSENKKKKKEGIIRNLEISGSASAHGEEGTQDIAHFIKALKANKNFFKYFDDIELITIKKAGISGQELMNFTLMCRFKKDESGA